MHLTFRDVLRGKRVSGLENYKICSWMLMERSDGDDIRVWRTDNANKKANLVDTQPQVKLFKC